MILSTREKHTKSAISILQQDSEYHLNRIKGLVNSKRITDYINSHLKPELMQLYLELEQEVQAEFARQTEQLKCINNKS